MALATLEPPSPAETLASLPADERRAWLEARTSDEIIELRRSWKFWARPTQLAPTTSWRWWVVSAGRGWGKNRTGSEWVLDRCEQFALHNHRHDVGLINSTYSDVRAVQIGGVSGLETVAERRGHVVDIGRTALDGRIRVWRPGEGWHDSLVEIHTADQPDRSRGRNLATVWGDELSKWKQKVDSEGGTAFTNVDFGLRALCPPGLEPQGLITMTPKAIKIVRDLLDGAYGDTVVTRGSMFANRRNLAGSFIRAIINRYANTRLGAQEIYGQLLDKVEGALWDGSDLEEHRVKIPATSPAAVLAALASMGIHIVSIVVGVDPAGGLRTETGIVVAGWAWKDNVPHLFVLDDWSMAGASDEWAPHVIEAAETWSADRIVAEVNYGGDMVRDVIQMRSPLLAVEKVTATRGKQIRAEPISGLWSQGRGHMVGIFGDLEGELTTWVPGDPLSPNRLDAMVWCGHALLPDLTSIDATEAYGDAVAEARL